VTLIVGLLEKCKRGTHAKLLCVVCLAILWPFLHFLLRPTGIICNPPFVSSFSLSSFSCTLKAILISPYILPSSHSNCLLLVICTSTCICISSKCISSKCTGISSKKIYYSCTSIYLLVLHNICNYHSWINELFADWFWSFVVLCFMFVFSASSWVRWKSIVKCSTSSPNQPCHEQLKEKSFILASSNSLTSTK